MLTKTRMQEAIIISRNIITNIPPQTSTTISKSRLLVDLTNPSVSNKPVLSPNQESL